MSAEGWVVVAAYFGVTVFWLREMWRAEFLFDVVLFGAMVATCCVLMMFWLLWGIG